MAKWFIIAVLGGLMLAGIMDQPASSKPNIYIGPDGFSLEFNKRKRNGKKCREHWHEGWSYDYRHYHCIPEYRSWRNHERRGHRYR